MLIEHRLKRSVMEKVRTNFLGKRIARDFPRPPSNAFEVSTGISIKVNVEF